MQEAYEQLPTQTKEALEEGVRFANHLHEDRLEGPPFIHLRHDDTFTIMMLGNQEDGSPVSFKQIRRDAPKMRRLKENVHAVVFGALGFITISDDPNEAAAIQAAKKSGTIRSIEEVPGSHRTLILEYHTRTHITRVAYPREDNGNIKNTPLIVTHEPAGTAKTFENIRFY